MFVFGPALNAPLEERVLPSRRCPIGDGLALPDGSAHARRVRKPECNRGPGRVCPGVIHPGVDGTRRAGRFMGRGPIPCVRVARGQFVSRDPVAATDRRRGELGDGLGAYATGQARSRSPGARERDHPVSGAPDCLVLDFATHSDLTGRLRGLIILLAERLTVDQARSADELIDGV